MVEGGASHPMYRSPKNTGLHLSGPAKLSGTRTRARLCMSLGATPLTSLVLISDSGDPSWTDIGLCRPLPNAGEWPGLGAVNRGLDQEINRWTSRATACLGPFQQAGSVLDPSFCHSLPSLLPSTQQPAHQQTQSTPHLLQSLVMGDGSVLDPNCLVSLS